MARRRTEPPLDPFERAARRVDPQYAVLAESAVPPKSLRAPRLLLVFAVIVIGAAVVNSGGDAGLKRSCTTPGFALGSTTVDLDAPLRWSVTGPSDDRVAVLLDETVVAGPRQLNNCLVHGSVRVQARTGRHRLTALITTTDGTVAARLSKTVTVR